MSWHPKEPPHKENRRYVKPAAARNCCPAGFFVSRKLRKIFAEPDLLWKKAERTEKLDLKKLILHRYPAFREDNIVQIDEKFKMLKIYQKWLVKLLTLCYSKNEEINHSNLRKRGKKSHLL